MSLLWRTLTIGRIGGIPIRLHASWLVVFGVVSWTLARPSELGDGLELTRPEAWTLAIATALAFFGSLLLHELGHSAVAIRNGLRIRSITLFIFGGVAELPREPESPGVEFRMAIAGPAVSLVLAAVFRGLQLASGESGAFALRAAAESFRYLAGANLVLVIFNLFPGFPLDGGRVLRALLWWWTGSERRATRVTTAIGGLFGLGLVGLGVAEAIWPGGSLFGAVWIALIGLFVRRAAAASYRHTVLRSGLDGLRVEDVMRPADVGPPSLDEARVSPGTGALAALETMRDRAYLLVFEGDLFRGLVTRRDILQAAALRADRS